MAVGGGSAERKAAELAALGDAAAAAWAAGAEGERRVAERLALLPAGWTVLHDRLLRPGLSDVNLDHVAVGPAGIFLIDAKNWGGAITAWNGGLYQHLGRGASRQSHARHQEVAKVHGMAAYMAAESGLPVTPIICLAGTSEATFGAPQLIRGVWVVPASKVVAWLLGQRAGLQPGEVERALVTTMTTFPSTTTDPDLLAAFGAARPNAPQRVRRTRSTSPPKHQAGGTTRQTRHPASPPQRTGRKRGLITLLALTLAATLVGFLAVAFGANLILTTLSGLGDRLAPSELAGPVVAASPGAGAVPSPLASPSAPMDPCARLTPAKIGTILGRTVQPVAVSTGCAWGTRLDDAETILVAFRTDTRASAVGSNYATSTAQHRVVYGMAYDTNYRPATGVWVAEGEPVTTGKAAIRAEFATRVVVSTATLDVTDDRARKVGLAVLTAAYSPSTK